MLKTMLDILQTLSLSLSAVSAPAYHAPEPNLCYMWQNWSWEVQIPPWPFPVNCSKVGSLSQTGQVVGREAWTLPLSMAGGSAQQGPGQLGEGC